MRTNTRTERWGGGGEEERREGGREGEHFLRHGFGASNETKVSSGSSSSTPIAMTTDETCIQSLHPGTLVQPSKKTKTKTNRKPQTSSPMIHCFDLSDRTCRTQPCAVLVCLRAPPWSELLDGRAGLLVCVTQRVSHVIHFWWNLIISFFIE